MKNLIALILLALTLDGYCQDAEKPSLFGREWKSLALPKAIEGNPVESGFPTAFTFTRKDGKVYFNSYYARPDIIIARDTFDLRGKKVSHANDWQTESKITISDDQKRIWIKRYSVYTNAPPKRESTTEEHYELLGNGDVLLRVTVKTDAPDLPDNQKWSYVGEKIYPKVGGN